jgi:membrane-anchored protein YejM (alkaline phosphatase superfamily)
MLSPFKGREKYTSHLSQVIFNLLFSPENSTNSKLQVPPCITTPQKGFSITGAATLVLGGVHFAHCSLKRKKKAT